MLSYEKLTRKPKVFKTFTGLTPEQCNTIYTEIEQQYPKQERKRLKRKNRKRENRLQAAEENLTKHIRAITQGKVKSRKDKDKRIADILKKHSVGSYIRHQGDRKGYGFRFWRVKEKIQKVEQWDGVFVFVTTETSMTALEMLESYRE
ncbi:MAG: hypothetical protein NT038_10990 [Euryarchaeota archaeon]|nr:hypothetical protein [Euryarchaeota archaeon]